MEAQSLIFGFSSTSLHTQKPDITFFPALLPASTQSPKWVPLKPQFFLIPRISWAKKVSSIKAVKSKSLHTHEIESSVETQKKKKFAVFVSGGGSNFKAIHKATLQGSIQGEVVVLVTNKIDCGGAKYARDGGVPVILFPKPKNTDEGMSPEDLVAALRKYKVDFILLAGYLKLIPPTLIQAYPRSILNVHPSLLPAFGGLGYYGRKVHEAVIASGARYSGPTIHYVDEEYDTGRILAQAVVPVLANDSADDLAARVLNEEHKLYVQVAAALCEERVVWREDGVPLIQSKDNPNLYL
ncbi:hypothetical protein DM860_006918 [Cuscuta australis]|uniref:Phosphoribosylglycinamide formyltransferase, chloroplastic n=1 Tax=Cuscuta australis TaxID=267555 RepID=A0A328E717_9ASTE|nr:hypothetical protein DM860_006918 [Cuscuta australis]